MVVKTFRGLLADGGQDQIRLSTNDGKTGYRIVKLDIFAQNPGIKDYENVVKVFKTNQSSITDDVDFTDSKLLAVAYLEGHSDAHQTDSKWTIFDNEVFNQDIYVTQKDAAVGEACNYYIELEVIPLAADEATVATLKNIKANA